MKHGIEPTTSPLGEDLSASNDPDMKPAEISDLRCRLGQSRADFARAFGVSLDVVYRWERGVQALTLGQRSYMVRLGQYAEEYSDQTARRPTLECTLRDRKVSQIHSDEVTLKN